MKQKKEPQWVVGKFFIDVIIVIHGYLFGRYLRRLRRTNNP